MEITKYLCEFFFGNFWHFLGLWVLIWAAFGGVKFAHVSTEKFGR